MFNSAKDEKTLRLITRYMLRSKEELGKWMKQQGDPGAEK